MSKSLVFSAVIVSALAIAYGAHEAEQPPAPTAGTTNSFAVRDVRIFDGRKSIARGTVVVRDGKIAALGAGIAIPSDLEVIDGRGKTLLPGLIDSHTHVFGDALQEALRFGVTTELDMFTDVTLMAQMKKAQAGGAVTDRADLRSAGTLITVAGGHGTEYFKIPTFVPGSDAQSFVDARIAEGSDYIKLIYDDGSAYGMQFPTLSKLDLAALAAAAHKRGKIAIAHIGSVEGAKIAIDAGVDGLAHISADAIPDGDFGRFVAAHGAFVVPTLTVNESASGVASGVSLITDKRLAAFLSEPEKKALHGSFPHGATSRVRLANALAAVRLLKAAGVPLLAGTDAPNPGTAHGVSLHRELELLVQAGLTPSEALTSATALPAEIFHLADRGRIAAGLRADLLLVDGDPTTDILQTRSIAAIWRNGVRLQRHPAVAAAAREPMSLALKAKVEDGRVSAFDRNTLEPLFGSGWIVTTDAMRGGNSTASIKLVHGGANGSTHCLEVRGEIAEGSMFPWAGAMLFLGSKPMEPLNLSSRKELVFQARGSGPFRVMTFAQSIGAIPASTNLTAGEQWREYVLPFRKLGDTDGRDLQAFVFGGADKGKFWLQIDDVRFR